MYQFNSLPYMPLRITSPYGYRGNIGIKGATEFHAGVDMGTDRSKTHTSKSGGAVFAVMPGTVLKSEFNSARGWQVIVLHGIKDRISVKTRYQHLAEKGLPVGTKVSAGDKIGTMGATGTGAQLHLHFELIENDKAIDPTWHLFNLAKEEDVKIEKIKVSINGKITEMEAVNINGNNYIKIRDIADSDTNDAFTVGYENKTVIIKSK